MAMEDYSLEGDLAVELNSGLKKLNIPASETQVSQLLALLESLYKWNKAYNLTAIKQPKEGLRLHILDSLTLYARFQALADECDLIDLSPQDLEVLDVGTGPGFPGLPLAIFFPRLKFSLLDSNSKKIRFIRQVIHQLGLKNVEPIHARVESLKERSFKVITSRAFASLKDMVKLTKPLLVDGGVWLAMKGDFSNSELDELPEGIGSKPVTSVEIPNVYAERCIVELNICGV